MYVYMVYMLVLICNACVLICRYLYVRSVYNADGVRPKCFLAGRV
mgnify:CR=1 FL=1